MDEAKLGRRVRRIVREQLGAPDHALEAATDLVEDLDADRDAIEELVLALEDELEVDLDEIDPDDPPRLGRWVRIVVRQRRQSEEEAHG